MFMETLSRYRWVILGIALLAQVSSSVVGQTLAPLAPLFQPELGLSKAEVGLFSSATAVGMWTMSMVSGSLIDRFGIRRIMALSQAVTGGLMLTMGMAGSALHAATVMFAAGVTRAPLYPGSTKAILDWFPPSARATVMGLKQTGMPVAGIIAATTLPTIGLILGWRLAMGVAGLYLIVGGILTAILYREPRHSAPVVTRPSGMRGDFKVVARNRGLWTASLVCLLFIMVQNPAIAYLPLYFKDAVLAELVPDERSRIVAAGGYLAICQAGGVFGRVFWGAVSDRAFQGRRAVVLAIIGAITTLATLAMAQLRPDSPVWVMWCTVIALGITAVGWNGAFLALLGDSIDRKHAATAVGFSLTLTEAGTIAGPPLFGFVVDVAGTYRSGWLLLAGLSVAGTLAALAAARERNPAASADLEH